MLEWIYCNEIEGLKGKGGDALENLLVAADVLGLSEVVVLAQKYLVEDLSIENLVKRTKILNGLAFKNCKELEKGIVRYMVRNLDLVFKRDDVMEIPSEIFYQVCKLSR